MTVPDDRATVLPAYVLIGGESRRFGKDKALYEVDGEPWALHVGRRLADQGDLITLVGREPPSQLLAGFAFARDAADVRGPLAGVLAALQDRRQRFGEGLLVLASCDLVRPERSWIEPLLSEFDSASDTASDLESAAYRSEDRWQPFPSVLHTRWLGSLEKSAADGMKSLQAAFDEARSVSLAWPHLPASPPQANCSEDLERLLMEARPEQEGISGGRFSFPDREDG